jgi:hypothetical protein
MKRFPTIGWILAAALAIGLLAWLVRALLAAVP